MTIIHRAGNVHKNADGLSRWALPNDENNPAYDPEEDEKMLPIMGIHITDYGDSFLELVRESYTDNKNTVVLLQLLMKGTKDQSLSNSLSEPWKGSFEDGRFSWFDGLIYHRTKHRSVITIVRKGHINTIFHECHVNVSSGHFSEDRTLERVNNNSWWMNWKEDTSECCSTCERCQKANKSTGKGFGLLMKIEEPSKPWDVIKMDWVTSLSPGRSCS